MQEDRRPNVGGAPLPPEEGAEPTIPADEMERQARLLRHREGADGHEPASPRPDEERPSG